MSIPEVSSCETDDSGSESGTEPHHINDTASNWTSNISFNIAPAGQKNESHASADKNELQSEPILTQAERDSFFAPMAVTAPEFKPTFSEPDVLSTLGMPIPVMLKKMEQFWQEKSQKSTEQELPSYKQKERTEICKFWLSGKTC